jgi:hypothetical protein
MYLRANKGKKDGKEHRYWSVEESRRLPWGRVVQRRVLYGVWGAMEQKTGLSVVIR